MCLFLFITAFVLMVGLPVAMLTFLLEVLISKYRRYLQTIMLITVMLFGALLLVDFTIYRYAISVINAPPTDAIIADAHPFPDMIAFSLNWYVPLMSFMILITLVMTRHTKKNAYFWVALAIAVLAVYGFFVLGQQVYPNFTGEDLHVFIWWL